MWPCCPAQAWASQLDEVPQQPVPESTRGEASGPCCCYTNESSVSRLTDTLLSAPYPFLRWLGTLVESTSSRHNRSRSCSAQQRRHVREQCDACAIPTLLHSASVTAMKAKPRDEQHLRSGHRGMKVYSVRLVSRQTSWQRLLSFEPTTWST